MEFGCTLCFQNKAAAFWEARPWESVARLVDESHFSVDVMKCRGCRQKSVKVFMEEIDWVDGDDPQTWVVVPLTEEEAGELIGQGEQVSEKRIEAMSAGRKYLVADFPKGGSRRIEWRDGPVWILRR